MRVHFDRIRAQPVAGIARPSLARIINSIAVPTENLVRRDLKWRTVLLERAMPCPFCLLIRAGPGTEPVCDTGRLRVPAGAESSPVAKTTISIIRKVPSYNHQVRQLALAPLWFHEVSGPLKAVVWSQA